MLKKILVLSLLMIVVAMSGCGGGTTAENSQVLYEDVPVNEAAPHCTLVCGGRLRRAGARVANAYNYCLRACYRASDMRIKPTAR